MREVRKGGDCIREKLRWAGYIIMAICFYYLIKMVLKLELNLVGIVKEPQKLFLLISYSIIFSFSLFIGAWGWKLIIEFLSGDHKLNYFSASRVYVKANIGKYLPGNIMHFAGRNLLGNNRGWQHSTLALSTFLEIWMLIITSVSLSLILNYRKCVDFLFMFADSIFSVKFLVVFCSLVLIIIVTIYFFRGKFKMSKILNLLFSERFLEIFPKIYLLYAGNFIVQGLMFVYICTVIGGIDIEGGYLAIIGAYILSWIIGFITPGSPGGLGVRESILILLLVPAYGKGPILISALVNRLASILGDVFALLFQMFIDKFIDRNDRYREEGKIHF